MVRRAVVNRPSIVRREVREERDDVPDHADHSHTSGNDPRI